MKTKRQKLEAKLDKIFSLYIRERDGKCCTPNVRFQCSNVLQCGHLFTRSDRATRFDKRFSFAQCSTHNLQHEYHPEIMTEWFIRKYGKELYLEGCNLTKKVRKFSETELQALIDEYE